MRNPIDIIIPIYNAYDDLQLCIDSIKRYTDLSLDRLILINDVSTDERMAGYLQSLVDENIVFINNETNQGFSNNVNIGMQYTDDRDVILLNSDTIVTRNWVDKIVECAYSADEIGTVTPLSNSATLCSIPVMCQDNSIPENVTIDELADIVEACSMKRYPRITVAVGFCMFIKRKAIQDVGLFDAKTFERGYGEENDFCNRAEQLGYIHVMCDDTFIYHKGTVSFMTEQKMKLIEAHDKVLNERYPEQMRNNHIYCITNPDKYIRDIINVYLHIKNGKKNILMLSHLDFRKDAIGNVGGTQFHVRDLTFGLLGTYNVFVMARDGEYIRLTIYTDNSEDIFKFYVGPKPMFFNFTNKTYKKIFSEILDAFKIDKVHVHHVDGISFDLFYEASRRNIPLLLTMHDYFFVCPNVKLIDSKCCYCRGNIAESECKQCLRHNQNITNTVDYHRKWRKECQRVLDMVDVIVTPSDDAKQIIVSIYKNIQDKIKVIEHGTEIQSRKMVDIQKVEERMSMQSCVDKIEYVGVNVAVISGWAILEDIDNNDVNAYVEIQAKGTKKQYVANKTARRDISEHFGSDKYIYSGINFKIFNDDGEEEVKVRFILEHNGVYYKNEYFNRIKFDNVNGSKNARKKIAFIGGMVPEKGSELSYQMITKAPQEEYEWYLMGDIGYEPLSELVQENFTRVGRYEVSELPEMVKRFGVELICILPIWPETFCYTLSEAILCNVPVLGTDIGAVGSRIKRHGYGWTVSANSNAEDILTKIKNIFEDIDDYKLKKQRAIDFKEITLKEMSDCYVNLYSSIEKESSYCSWDRKFIVENLYIDDSPALHETNVVERKLNNIIKHQNDIIQQNKKAEEELREIKKSKAYRYMFKLLKILGKR